MQSGYINIGTEQIHYLHTGKGNRLLLGFHGYGNDAHLFKDLVNHLQNDFTMIFIDLPHHGNTTWGENSWTKQELCTLVSKFMDESGVSIISLVGYSIGGRLCLCIAEQLPDVIDQCILIASDGLTHNRLYHFVTKNNIGKWIFRKFLANEKHVRMISTLYRIKLIGNKKYRFAMHYLKTSEDRKKLHDIWATLSPLVPDPKYLKRNIKENNIHMTIFMGERDAIIPVAKARSFMKDLPSVKLYVLNKGHRMLNAETTSLVAKTLLNQ